MSGNLRETLLASNRRPDADEAPLFDGLKEELLAIVSLCGPACVQLGFQQACHSLQKYIQVAQRAVNGPTRIEYTLM